MRTRKNSQTLLCFGALITFGLSLSMWADETHWPLRVRGGNELKTQFNKGVLIVQFQPGDGTADEGLRPGEGSWLDRALRPTEPHTLQQTISEDQATELIVYLCNSDNYVTFYTANGGNGFFVVFSSAPYVQGEQTPSEPRGFVWSESVNVGGHARSGGEGEPFHIGSGNGVTGGTRVIGNVHGIIRSEHEGKERHMEKEHHLAEGSVHRGAEMKHEEIQRLHEREHIQRGGGHQVSLVKAVNRPLVRPIHRPLVKPAAPRVNHPSGGSSKKRK